MNTTYSKEEILNYFAQAYQKDRHAPIAGKIIGLFTISPQRYLSFEEIRDELQISKGALSKNLKVLIDLKRIKYITDDSNVRKRLFGLDLEGITEHLAMVVTNIRFHRDLSIMACKIRGDKKDEVFNFIQNSVAFCNEIIHQLETLSEKHFTKKTESQHDKNEEDE